MNKEIKFRAWDKVSKMWLDITGFECINGAVYGIFHDGDYVGLKDIELMQYTGLKDKNGKEIYEGDIVKIKHIFSYSKIQFDSKLTESEENEINSIVVFDAGRFRIKYPNILSEDLANFLAYDNESENICCCGKHIESNDRYGHFSKTENEFIGVIGNIHDNPELIKANNEN